jgi:hypothetical protein
MNIYIYIYIHTHTHTHTHIMLGCFMQTLLDIHSQTVPQQICVHRLWRLAIGRECDSYWCPAVSPGCCCSGNIRRCTSHVTRHTSHVTCHTSHVTRHTSHVTRHTSYLLPPTSLLTLLYFPDIRATSIVHSPQPRLRAAANKRQRRRGGRCSVGVDAGAAQQCYRRRHSCHHWHFGCGQRCPARGCRSRRIHATPWRPQLWNWRCCRLSPHNSQQRQRCSRQYELHRSSVRLQLFVWLGFGARAARELNSCGGKYQPGRTWSRSVVPLLLVGPVDPDIRRNHVEALRLFCWNTRYLFLRCIEIDKQCQCSPGLHCTAVCPH